MGSRVRNGVKSLLLSFGRDLRFGFNNLRVEIQFTWIQSKNYLIDYSPVRRYSSAKRKGCCNFLFVTSAAGRAKPGYV